MPKRTGPLRVAMVSARALPQMGGVETHVDEVARRLAAAGVGVTVLATDTTGELVADEQRAGYRILRWPSYPKSRDFYFSPALSAHLRRARGVYDIVHVQGVHSLVAPVALASVRAAGIPSVLTFHTGGHSSGVRGALRPMQWKLLAPLLRTTRALVAVCEYERHTFARALGVAEARIRLIPNGCTPLPIDTGAAQITGAPLLVSAGRLERYKGHHRLIEAMPTVLRRSPDAMLAVVGTGPYEQSLRDLAVRLGVADRVLIGGFGPEQRGALGRVVSDADVVCLLSEYEAHPVAVLEALSAGTPVLVADTSGLSELGRRGLVTTVGLGSSPQEIAARVLDVAGGGKTAAPVLPSWDDCAGQLVALYEQSAG